MDKVKKVILYLKNFQPENWNIAFITIGSYLKIYLQCETKFQ